MPEQLATPLSRAATESFETLAFCFVELGPLEPFSPDEVDGVVVVAFRGPFSGALALQLSGGILATLTANMLGLDETPSPELQLDALGEAANVICGNVLPRVAGPSAMFSLGAPAHFEHWEDALAAVGQQPTLIRLRLEGGRADVAFSLMPAA